MKSTILAISLISLALFLTGTSHAADLNHGKELHDANCTSCHDTKIYTRPKRRVTSLDKLRAQVRRCDSSLGTKWFDEDIEDVVQYLRTEYYQF